MYILLSAIVTLMDYCGQINLSSDYEVKANCPLTSRNNVDFKFIT
jgi:hypothetical protein